MNEEYYVGRAAPRKKTNPAIRESKFSLFEWINTLSSQESMLQKLAKNI